MIGKRWFLWMIFAAAAVADVADDGPAPPYTVAMKEAYLEQVRQSPYVTPTASADARLVIGTTRGWQADDYPFDLDEVEDHLLAAYADVVEIPSHPLYGFRITDPEVDYPAVTVVLTDGNHNTEHTGSWAFEGMVDFLLSDDPRADKLRRYAVFYIYPMVNPDGRYTLVGRCNPEIVSAGWLDHNRMWHSAGLLSTIDTLVPAIRFDTGTRVDYALDFHSTSRTFIFSLPELANHPFIHSGDYNPRTGNRTAAYHTQSNTRQYPLFFCERRRTCRPLCLDAGTRRCLVRNAQPGFRASLCAGAVRRVARRIQGETGG